jgi:hypothetical protein
LIYYVNVSENVSVGDPDDYIINGVIGYNQLTQIYTIKIDESTIADFATGDIVQVLEHNTTNGYSLPNELTVATSPRFEQQSYVLDLFSSSFNTFNSQVNGDQTAPNGSLTIDPLARGYIKKKRLFTVAKGIIGVK